VCHSNERRRGTRRKKGRRCDRCEISLICDPFSTNQRWEKSPLLLPLSFILLTAIILVLVMELLALVVHHGALVMALVGALQNDGGF